MKRIDFKNITDEQIENFLLSCQSRCNGWDLMAKLKEENPREYEKLKEEDLKERLRNL